MPVCGIAGVWTGRADPLHRREVVSSMLGAMAGRGPDGSRLVEREAFTVGFSLLAIVGRSDNRAQPVEAGAVVAGLNGEVYNYRSLARQRGLDAESLASDAMVLPALCEDVDFPNSLDGMFAGFIFDSARQRLVLFRDHVGIKPMYAARVGGAVVFGSTLCAVAAAAGFEHIEPLALDFYLRRGYPPTDRSLVAGVELLPAGTTWTFDSPESPPKLRRWFDPQQGGSAPAKPFELATLTQSVLDEVPRGMPTTIALSGGLDSTSLALILRAAGYNPATLSVTYDAEDERTSQDESMVARLASDFGLSHTDVHVGRRDLLSEVERPWRFDVPIADPNAVPLSRLARRAADLGSRVMLTGDGADELFAGYAYHVAAARPVALGRLHARLGGRMEEPLDRRFAHRLTRRRQLRRIAPGGPDPVTAVRLDDLNGWLEPNLLTKADRFGMAESVELRVPFLRPWLVRAAFAMNPSRLVAGGTAKQALRRVVAPLLPDYVLARQKVGFSAPLDSWLRSPDSRDLAERAAEDLSGMFEAAKVRQLWQEHLRGERSQAQQLWRLAVLRSWMEGFADTRRGVTVLTAAQAQPSASGVEPE